MRLEMCENEFGLFLDALRFAAEKHSEQRRKGKQHNPYINHPIQVAHILWEIGQVRDATTLTAALLHDTVEDTDATPEEIEERFGEDIRGLVMEVTDDKQLEKSERKARQVQSAPYKSPRARQIKLADKINNVTEIAFDPPPNWSLQRRREYLDWTEQVVAGLRGYNPALEARYDEVLAEARRMLAAEEDRI